LRPLVKPDPKKPQKWLPQAKAMTGLSDISA